MEGEEAVGFLTASLRRRGQPEAAFPGHALKLLGAFPSALRQVAATAPMPAAHWLRRVLTQTGGVVRKAEEEAAARLRPCDWPSLPFLSSPAGRLRDSYLAVLKRRCCFGRESPLLGNPQPPFPPPSCSFLCLPSLSQPWPKRRRSPSASPWPSGGGSSTTPTAASSWGARPRAGVRRRSERGAGGCEKGRGWGGERAPRGGWTCPASAPAQPGGPRGRRRGRERLGAGRLRL